MSIKVKPIAITTQYRIRSLEHGYYYNDKWYNRIGHARSALTQTGLGGDFEIVKFRCIPDMDMPSPDDEQNMDFKQRLAYVRAIHPNIDKVLEFLHKGR